MAVSSNGSVMVIGTESKIGQKRSNSYPVYFSLY